MHYWWVNQIQTWRDENRGGYLWSPKRSNNDRRNQFYDNMRTIAIGIIQSVAFESPKPMEFSKSGNNLSNVGCARRCRHEFRFQ
jgi:putative restriction endonuclease